ncbi:hypothetical protein PIB30_100542 [Stylosanthes scabra]|uniref:Aminotransferase-like plant mobile domain-containing protein n=1 Tax=Stylosanthes scabra TaxID=79078 RepID=A0ABU6WVD2_9FABA|nr:hypothetical protein [Stylosanthes scabra]
MNTFTFPLPDCPQDHRFYRRKADPFPFSTKPKTPEEVQNLAKQCLFYWLHKLLLITHITADPRHFNVDMPYCTCVVPIIKGPIPEEMMWYIWALSAQYDCAIAVPAFAFYHLLCEPQFSGTYLDQLLSMFAPVPLWRGKLYNALQAQGIWNVSYRKKQKFYCFFILRRHFHYDRHYDTLYTRNNINIVGYSKIWPIKERDCLNTLVSHLHNCNNPGLQVINGIEGLSLSEEEASSSQNMQEDLSQFQTNFFTSSIIFPTPPLSQDSDPWGGPLSQDPYNYEEEPGARVYHILSSPIHVDARIDDDAIDDATEEYDRLGNQYCPQSDDDNFAPQYDDFADHEPIIK